MIGTLLTEFRVIKMWQKIRMLSIIKLLKNDKFNLQHSILNYIILVCIFVFCLTTILNVYIGQNYTAMITSFSFILSIYAFKKSYYEKNYNLGLLLLVINIVFISFPLTFFSDEGLNGPLPYFVVLFSGVIAVLFSGRKRVLILIGYYLVFFILIFLQFKYPFLVRKYESETLKNMDLIFTIVISSLALIFMVKKVIDSYIEEQNCVELLNKKLIEEKNKYEMLSRVDGLTELYNHQTTKAYLQAKLLECTEQNTQLAVLFVDIDNFKALNDTYGHSFGDIVLKKVSETIKNSLRDDDIVGRMGGEEFLVIMPSKDINNALSIAERIRSNIESLTWINGEIVTISGGIALSSSSDINDLLKESDRLLYVAKSTGKNKIVY